MLVLVVAVGVAVYAGAMQRGPVRSGYVLHGRFVSANGLHVGADVDLGGVAIGRVVKIALDPATQMAQVDFTVPDRLRLPEDTTLGIGAPTMTADNALQVLPGKSAGTLAAGATVLHTTDQVSLEQQVSNYIFGGGNLGN